MKSAAPPERSWELIARPDRWSDWSPHVRGAEGLGEPEVRVGSRGRVLLRGRVSVGAEITAVEPGRSWSWRVGGIEVHHAVEARADGSVIRFAVEARDRRWSPAALAYAPLVGLIARNLARVAGRRADAS